MTTPMSDLTRETLARVAPGTGLRDGLERILRGGTGALIVLGHDDDVEKICDGGFHLDVEFAPTRLRELAKMDGALVLSTDGARILRANVQLMPDPTIPTNESGTRHRAAERTAIQTGYPVISVRCLDVDRERLRRRQPAGRREPRPDPVAPTSRWPRSSGTAHASTRCSASCRAPRSRTMSPCVRS